MCIRDRDYIDGLSPAISIDQKTTSQNPRSTVGTVTEIYDYIDVYKRQEYVILDENADIDRTLYTYGFNSTEDTGRIDTEIAAVSYTHLDVYKRQGLYWLYRLQTWAYSSFPARSASTS